jgi:hypothetical protein
MRYLSLNLGPATAVLLLASAPAAAGPCCSHAAPAPAYIYSEPTVPVTHYAFEPPAQVNQIYVVNQGPYFSGPGIYAHNDIYAPTLARPPGWAEANGSAWPYPSSVTGYPYVHVRKPYGWRYAIDHRHLRIAPSEPMPTVLPPRYWR